MRFLLVPLLVLCILFPAFAASEYEQWVESEQQSYQSFREKRDKAFSSYLQKQWETFTVFAGQVRDDTPKPDVVPTAPDMPTKKPSVPPPPPEPAPKEPTAKPEPEPTPDEVPEPPLTMKQEGLPVTFLGHELHFPVNEAWKELTLTRTDNQGVSDFWKQLAGLDVNQVVQSLTKAKQELQLNGWGYLRLLASLAEKLYGPSQEALLTTWGLMLKSGYDIRVGLSGDSLYLLFPASQKIYERSYFTLDGQRYYLFTFADPGRVGSLATYKDNYQGAGEALDIALEQRPRTDREVQERTIDFTYLGEDYSVTAPVNETLIGFMDEMPQLGLEHYFSGRPASRFEQRMVRELKRYIAGMDTTEQVNFLLHFVQTAFEYQRDKDQFHREKYLYPEETAYYPASDCEDRSVFFAWLVREIPGLKVIGLDYPGHVATAVALDEDVQGASIRYQGRKYTIADPTYKHAEVGMVIPRYKDKQPEIIEQGYKQTAAR